MSRRKASIYSISSNHSRAIESELNDLAELAKDGEIRGLTYVLNNARDKLELGSVGSHQADESKAIGVLFRAAVALSFAA